MPLRDRNALLQAAGYAPVYRETPLGTAELAQVRRVVGFMLKQAEPHPAVAIDRYWNILAGNRSHYQVLNRLLDSPEGVAGNLMRLAFHPAGLRPSIANWDLAGPALMQRLHREMSTVPDEKAQRLVDEIMSYPGIRDLAADPEIVTPPPMLLHLHLRKGDVDLKLCTTITTLGTAQDITLQELRIESFFPADEETERSLRAMLEGTQASPEVVWHL